MGNYSRKMAVGIASTACPAISVSDYMERGAYEEGNF